MTRQQVYRVASAVNILAMIVNIFLVVYTRTICP